MTYLLFDPSSTFLGELHFSHGALASCVLSKRGEELLGAEVRRWQTEGIPNEESKDYVLPDQSIKTVFSTHRVQPRTAKFEAAFKHWSVDTHCAIIDLPERLLGAWQKLLQLDLAPEELFGSISMMRTSSHAMLQKWEKAVDQVAQAMKGQKTAQA